MNVQSFITENSGHKTRYFNDYTNENNIILINQTETQFNKRFQTEADKEI